MTTLIWWEGVSMLVAFLGFWAVYSARRAGLRPRLWLYVVAWTATIIAIAVSAKVNAIQATYTLGIPPNTFS